MRTDNNRVEKCPTIAYVKEKKSDEEKQCKNKEFDRAREKTWINIGMSGFVRTQERRRVGCFSAGQVRTPA